VTNVPSRRESIAARGRALPCPYCGSHDTERTAEFGPFHMTEQYHCRSCKSPFSRMRWEETAAEAPAPNLRDAGALHTHRNGTAANDPGRDEE
jgi:hypothetical protein